LFSSFSPPAPPPSPRSPCPVPSPPASHASRNRRFSHTFSFPRPTCPQPNFNKCFPACNDHLVLRIITGGCTFIAYVEVAHCWCFSL
jgi:hypothetical protein